MSEPRRQAAADPGRTSAGRRWKGGASERRRPSAGPAHPSPERRTGEADAEDVPAPYSVYLEIGAEGGCMAHVAELPGCCAVGPDEAMVLAEVPDAIARHRAWRAAHGLPRIGDEGAPLVVRQTVIGPRPWRMDGASALFSVDRRLLTDQEFEGHLRVLACARADLLRAAHAIPRGAFDEAAPGQTRTVRDILAHVADSEEWLISRLGRRVHVSEPDPLRRIVDVRAHTLEHLTRYDRVDRDLIFVPTERMSEDPDEMWSLRKFLRRLIEHELQHMDDLTASADHWSGGTGLE